MKLYLIEIEADETNPRMDEIMALVKKQADEFSFSGMTTKGKADTELPTGAPSFTPQSPLEVCILNSPSEFHAALQCDAFKDSVLLFLISVDHKGTGLGYYCAMRSLFEYSHKDKLSGCTGGIIVDNMQGDWFTKNSGRTLAFAANMTGCTFPGKPFVEATSNLKNFSTLAYIWDTDLLTAYHRSCSNLLSKLLEFHQSRISMCSAVQNNSLSQSSSVSEVSPAPVQTQPSESGSASDTPDDAPKILAIHAGNRKTSNSLALWHLVADSLTDPEILSAHPFSSPPKVEEISVRNGQIWDCRGCKYDTCVHFGEKGDCFYGGVIAEKVYPAIIRSDILVLVCPNYNDSVSANIMAFINRLTAVFRTHDFSSKRIYAVIVSGYSGGDIVAQQIIGAINMNKNMILPAEFALIETANSPGEILSVPGIKEKAAKFAAHILSY